MEEPMADDTENHTLRLLQEMRSEMHAMRKDMTAGFAELREEAEETNTRIAGLSYFMATLAGNFAEHSERLDAVAADVDAMKEQGSP